MKIYNLIFKKTTENYLLNFDNSFANPKKYYLKSDLYFKKFIVRDINNHRSYYSQNKRAYGEDAFTTMWYLLYEIFEFHNFLEIGVFRGHTISLITLLATNKNRLIQVSGISPLTSLGDTVSIYPDIDYELDIETNFSTFNLPLPKLVKALSTDEVAILEMSSTIWDCVYIDGNHDFEIVKADFNNVFPFIKKGGVVVFDDASANLGTNEFYGGFSGHPGPSDFVDTLDRRLIVEILRVGHNRCFMKL